MKKHTNAFSFKKLSLFAFISLLAAMASFFILDRFNLLAHIRQFHSQQWLLVFSGFIGLVAFLGLYRVLHQSDPLFESQDDATRAELQLLRERFRQAVAFLKKTTVKLGIPTHIDNPSSKEQQQRLIKLPWFLALGATDAGKTTLLENSGLKFLLSKKQNSNGKTLAHCQWWGTREAIFLDTPGNYTLHDKDDEKTRIKWLDFLNLISRARIPPLNGILIALSLEQLSLNNKEQQQCLIRQLKKRLQEINAHFNSELPVYLIVTKMDMLNGFNEFFDNLSRQDRQQAWGISFSQTQINSTQRLVETFDTEYNQVLKRLHEQLIPRLHQERNQQKRLAINEFPYQMEHFKTTLTRLIQQLAEQLTVQNTTLLRGLYFSSALPTSDTLDRLIKSYDSAFALQPYQAKTNLPATTLVQQRKAVFTSRLFKEIIFQDALNFTVHQHRFAYPSKPLKLMTSLTAVGIVAGCTAYWLGLFSHEVGKLNQAEDAIREYQLLLNRPSSQPEKDIVVALNRLHYAAKLIGDTHLPSLIPWSTHHQDNLQISSKHAYQQAIQDLIQNDLINSLNTEIKRGDKASPDELYGSLKAYLMLASPANADSYYLSQWFTSHWPQQNQSAPTSKQLIKHIESFLNHRFEPVPLNQSLVKQARTTLQLTSPSALALAILHHDYLNHTGTAALLLPKLAPTVAIFTNKNNKIILPALYTANHFESIYEDYIPQACTTALQGNAVLGTKAKQIHKTVLDHLIETTREHYLQAYISNWQQVLNQLQLQSPKKLEHAIQLIDSFVQLRSPINELLNTLHHHTYITHQAIQTPISIRFQALHKFISGYDRSNMLGVRANLQQLQDSLNTIANDKHPDMAALRYTKQRFIKNDKDDPLTALAYQAQMAPEPFKSWLNNLQQSTWQLLLNYSAHALNQQWQQQITPFYQQQLANRYPLQTDGQAEIRFTDFHHFFGPQGVIDEFTTDHLKPFIDLSQSALWQWKQIDGKALPFKQSVLSQLQLADLIKSVFFSENRNTPSVKFSMQSIDFPDRLKQVLINLDDQQMSFDSNHLEAQLLHWPGPNSYHYATINFLSAADNPLRLNATGDWAWFHVLDKATLENSNHPQRLTAKFNYQGQTVSYEILAESMVNPFSPSLLKQFRCPLALS